MAEIGVALATRDVGSSGKWRVEKDDARAQLGEEITNVLGVVPGDGRVGEETAQELEAGVGELVEMERYAGGLGEDGEHAGTGAGLEEHVAAAKAGSAQRGVGHGQWGGELLAGELLFGPTGVGGFESGETLEHAHHGLGVFGLSAHRGSETAEKEDERCLGGFVGVAPGPSALGVVGAERVGECVAQDRGSKGQTPTQRPEEAVGGAKERGGAFGRGEGRAMHGNTPGGEGKSGWMPVDRPELP